MIKHRMLKFIVIASLLQVSCIIVANNALGREEEDITDEMIAIINNLELLENFEMFGEDLSLLDEYEEIEAADTSEFTGEKDDK